MGSKVIVCLEGVKKSFKNKEVLKSINLKVEKGNIIGIEGESGAGKTTLFKTILGLTDSDEGKVTYYIKNKEYDLNELKKYSNFNSKIGMSCQEGSFYNNLTVYDNLEFFATMYELDKDKIQPRIKELIKLVNLTGDEFSIAKNLSAGMQKRLDVACSIIHEPEIIFLDEPTAHLDDKNREEIWKLIKQINDRGFTILINSHFPKDLKKNCNKVYSLKNCTLKNENPN